MFGVSYREEREHAGESLYKQGNVIELSVATGQACYTVDNGQGKVYFVNENSCSCPDYTFRRDSLSEKCKHQYAVAAFVAANRPRYQINDINFLTLVCVMERAADDLESYPSTRNRRIADTLRTAVKATRTR